MSYVPLLRQDFRVRKIAVGLSQRMDETYARVKGTWKHLHRAVDKAGATVDFLLTAKWDRKAALRFLRKATKRNDTPEKIRIDKNGANRAAIESHNAEHEASIEIRQIKYLNNIVEQDHRAIKRLVRLMLGSKRLTRNDGATYPEGSQGGCNPAIRLTNPCDARAGVVWLEPPRISRVCEDSEDDRWRGLKSRGPSICARGDRAREGGCATRVTRLTRSGL
jgi:DDE domain